MTTLAQVVESGERVDPSGHTHEDLNHLARYAWACSQVSGPVLDVACGTGYGTAALAAVADEVIGVDGDASAISIAPEVHPSNARYVQHRLPALPFERDRFDWVVSFETVEHIDDDLGFLSELRRVLSPGGTLLLSTPNKAVTSPDGPPLNPWHVREYRLDELVALVRSAGFAQVEVFAQQEPSEGFVARQILRAVARFPALCRPDQWWDRMAHGASAVRPHRGGWPTTVVLRCR